jgi:hypothetical protein
MFPEAEIKGTDRTKKIIRDNRGMEYASRNRNHEEEVTGFHIILGNA